MPLIASLGFLLEVEVFFELVDFAGEDQHFFITSACFLNQLLPRLFHLGELFGLYSHFSIQFLVVFLLYLRISLHILYYLLLLQILLSNTLYQCWINFRLLDFSLQKYSQSLSLLYVEGEFCLILLYFCEFQGLFQVRELFFFEKELLIYLFNLKLQ